MKVQSLQDPGHNSPVAVPGYAARPFFLATFIGRTSSLLSLSGR